MSADLALPAALRDQGDSWTPTQERTALISYVRDVETEAVLRQGLANALPDAVDIRRGGIRAAISEMQRIATPRTLIIDVGGEEQPLGALAALSQVVEPDVQVLVIGDSPDLDFYREVTRGLGAREYVSKPLTREAIIRLFIPVILGESLLPPELSSGRMVAITGARGGVGATTIAANLAWHFGVARNRHTLLLDPNLQTGSAALYIDAKPGPGLRAALEMPDRIDDLFIERVAQELKNRLHVLASQEPLVDLPSYAPDAAQRMLGVLRRRYNFVIADIPFQPVRLYRDLLDLADQRVIVFEPMLAGVRDALRLRSLHANRATAPTILVLNRLGMPGGLTRAQVEEALEMKVDVAIPDLRGRLTQAANMGDPAMMGKTFFRLRDTPEIARLVAFNRLLDTPGAAGGDRRESDWRRGWRRWLRRK